MSDKLTVDVIIPTYNGLPWLKATVESVLSQTYQQLHLYVIDDGSTDKTKQYVKSLADQRVTYIHKKNGGQSTARNLGVALSHAPLVAFLDSDDIWYPTKLEKQVAIMQKNHKVGLVYGHYYLIDEQDVVITYLQVWHRGRIFNDLLTGNTIAGSASMVLIRRSILDIVGPFREDFLIGEDWDMWLRISRICDIDFVPEIIAGLRHRSDGMQKNTRKMADGLVYAYEVIRDEFALRGIQRRAFANATLFTAAQHYAKLGLRTEARRTLLRLFKESPLSFFDNHGWQIKVAPSFFIKALGNNFFFVSVERITKSVYHLTKRVLAWPLRKYLLTDREARRAGS